MTELAISRAMSKSGSEVLCVNGLATASLVNPEMEARRWAEAQRKRVSWARSDEPLFVLGVGSGFHLHALMAVLDEMNKVTSPIVALDTCEASISFARERLSNVSFSCVDPQHFDRANGLSFTQHFTLLVHRPTVARSGARLQAVEEFLLGRSPETFAHQLKQRPQIAAGLNPGRASALAEAKRLSVRDLSRVWDISSETKTDRRIFRVLEELVR